MLRFEEDSAPAEDKPKVVSYADAKYGVGEFVEGKTQRGGWVPCIVTQTLAGGFYNVHLADSFPGHDLPNVPSALLRRPLANDTQDFLVDNSILQHTGPGLKYRHSKHMSNKSSEYVQWGMLVVGHDEEDGWVSTGVGYLPVEVNGSRVLKEVPRKGPSTQHAFDSFLAALKANLSSSNSVQMSEDLRHEGKYDEPERSLPLFSVGEWGEFRTKAQGWHPMQVRSLGTDPNTYNIVVRPTDFSAYTITNAHRENMRKVGRQPHELKEGESPVCRRGGCIVVQVNDAKGGKYTIQVGKEGRLDMLMRAVCNRMKIEWAKCKTHVAFKHNDVELNATTHVMGSGLQDQDLVEALWPGMDADLE